MKYSLLIQKSLLTGVLFASLIIPTAASARGNGYGHGHDNGNARWSHDDDQGDHHDDKGGYRRRFASDEVTLILNWYGTHPRDEGGRLPPGLEKQLRERGHLPPGLQGRELPPSLLQRIGPPPRGCERIIVGSDLLLVEVATGVLLDIIHNVF